MRILQVTIYADAKFGGPPQKIHALCRGLANHGHQVQVITFRSRQSAGKHYEGLPGVRVQYLAWLGRSLWQLPLNLKRLWQAVRQTDVIHCYGLYDLLCPLATCFARHLKRPYVLEPLGMYVPRAGNTRAKLLYHRLCTKPMARGAAKVIATSPAEVEELTGLVESEKLVLRRNGIDLDEFQGLPAPAAFQKAHGIAPDERVVLYMGRISPIKNLEMLISAFKRAALARTRLFLVGPSLEPSYEARLKCLITELGLNNQVVLVGPLYNEAKLAALAAADLFVLPSEYESFGNAAAEAVAAGVPVLLTETCGIAPLIHGRAGLAVPVTVEALADGLRIMVEDNANRQAWLGQRDEVLKELSWEAPLQATEELYETIIRRAAGQRA